MKMKKIITLSLLIITLLINTGCSKISPDKLNLINSINAKHYCIKGEGADKIVFEFKSSEFSKLVNTLNNESAKTLINKITFFATWRPYSNVQIAIKNKPKFKDRQANAGLEQMLRGMSKEINGLFMMLSPIMNEPIDNRSIRQINVVEKENTRIINVKYSKDISIEYTVNKSNNQLLKSEIFKNTNKISIIKYKFRTYKTFFLLTNLETDLIGDKSLKSKLDIQYVEKNTFLIPQEITFESMLSGRKKHDKIQLIPLDISRTQ